MRDDSFFVRQCTKLLTAEFKKKTGNVKKLRFFFHFCHTYVV
jgi:hypothetical protein